jgi:hypothetical protein
MGLERGTLDSWRSEQVVEPLDHGIGGVELHFARHRPDMKARRTLGYELHARREVEAPQLLICPSEFGPLHDFLILELPALSVDIDGAKLVFI